MDLGHHLKTVRDFKKGNQKVEQALNALAEKVEARHGK